MCYCPFVGAAGDDDVPLKGRGGPQVGWNPLVAHYDDSPGSRSIKRTIKDAIYGDIIECAISTQLLLPAASFVLIQISGITSLVMIH